MSLGPQTAVVDGQRNTFPTVAQFNPQFYGQQTTGVPNVSPTMPPFISATNGAGSSMGFEGINGYGTAGNNLQATQMASDHPYSIRSSPLWWAIAALVGGILLLRGTAWRKTVLESGDASARVGPASAEAREEA